MDPINVQFFISLIRDHPELWQKFRKTQCSEEYITKTWNHIGSCLSPPISGLAAATNFKTLENLFNKCHQFAKATDRSGANPGFIFTPQWQHYNELCFLKDQIPPRSTVSSMSRVGLVNLIGAVKVERHVKDAAHIDSKDNGGKIEEMNGIIAEKLKDTRSKMTHSTYSGSHQMIKKPLGESNFNGESSSQHLMANSLSPLKYSIDLTQNSSSENDSDDDEEFERRFPPFLHVETDRSESLDDETVQSLSSQSQLENSQLEEQKTRNVVKWCRKRMRDIASREETSTQLPTGSPIGPHKKFKLHDESGGSSLDTLGTMCHEGVSPSSSNAGSAKTPLMSVILSMLSTLISVLSQVPEELLFEFMSQMLELARGLPTKEE